MARRGRICAVVVIVGAILLSRMAAAWAAEIPWKIDIKTASRLAAEAVGHGTEPSDFDYQSRLSPPFFVFDGLSPPSSEGSFGFFAVNPWTGEVWALWGCHKIRTSASRESQAEIRRRFTREERKQYARLSRLKPQCVIADR